jgi:hypothetical protein
MHYTCSTCNVLHFAALRCSFTERRNRLGGIVTFICEVLSSKLRRWPAILSDVFCGVPYFLWEVAKMGYSCSLSRLL